MKKRSAWIAALAAVLVIALVIGFWPGRSAQPTETTLGAVPELVVLPGEPGAASVAESAADGAAGALGTEPASGTAAAPGQTGAAETGKSAPAGETGKAAPAQKTFTPPIRNLLTESIGAPAPEIPAAQLITEPADVTDPGILEREDVSYDGEHFMVKLVPESDGTVTPALSAAGVTALEPMMRVDSGAWYLAYVGENGDVSAAVNAARAAEGVLTAEYDFVSQTMADMPMTEAVTENVRENPRVMEAWHLRACGIQQAWQYQAQNDLPVAGDGTIVAVIDTGVDYTHKELTASMWRNLNEIPDNGTDDDGNGDVKGIECVKMELGAPDASGRRRPVEIEGSNFVFDVDYVIMAIGTKLNTLILDTTDHLAANERGGIGTDERANTNRPEIFAGGDAVTGAATVIKAMGAGKVAAAGIDEYLQSK